MTSQEQENMIPQGGSTFQGEIPDAHPLHHSEDYQEEAKLSPLPEALGVSIEEAMEKSGGMGTFQYFAFFIIVMGMGSTSFIFYNLNYLELEPEYECQYLPDPTYSQCESEAICSEEDPPDSWRLGDSEMTLQNWIEQMDMYCATEFQIGLIGSIYLCGCFCASFVLPRLADMYGRKPVFLFGLFLYMIDAIGYIFCENMTLMYVLLFVGGIAETGAYYISYVYCVEFAPASFQNLTGLGIFLVFAFLKMFLAVYFWFISKNWIWLMIPAFVFAVSSFVGSWLLLPDSPRYFYSKKKWTEARAAFKVIQRMNGLQSGEYFVFEEEKESFDRGRATELGNKINTTQSQLESQSKLLDENQRESGLEQTAVQAEKALKGNFRELIQTQLYLKNLLLMMVIWSACAFGTYLLPYYLDTMNGNVFLFGIFTSTAEVIACIFCALITKKVALKVCMLAFFIISAVACLLLVFLGEYEGIYVDVIVMLANFGLISAFNIAYLINLELFPTIFMATAYGICNIFGRGISILSPLIARMQHPIPMAILTAYSGLVALLVMFLKKVK